MPFSIETLNSLEILKSDSRRKQSVNPLFVGSMYEPRTSTLNSIRENLLPKGIEFEIRGRVLGSKRVSDSEYWEALVDSPIVLTTADQIPQAGADWPWLPHFVYRYTEVLAAGSLLFAPNIPGVSRYFLPGVHFVSFDGVEDAAEKITFFVNNKEERIAIANNGNRQIKHLVTSRCFWLTIDVALGYNSLS